MYSIGWSALGIQIVGFNIAFRIFIVERWTLGGIHWRLAPVRLIPQEAITIGHREGRRLASRRKSNFRHNFSVVRI